MIDGELLAKIVNSQVKKSFYSFLIKAFDEINPGKEFVSNWHLRLFCDALSDQSKKRLIVNIPPRYLKSVCFSVAFPAWYIGNNPNARIIIATYSATLSAKHAGDARRIMQSEWYQAAFPEASIASGFNTQFKFGTSKNGYYFATSVGGTLTGEGGDIIIVDDPHNPSKIHSKTDRTKVQRWSQETLFSRLNDKENGRIIIVMQRLHQDDLTGYLLGSNAWEQISLPAVSEREEVIKMNNKVYHVRQKGEPLNPKRENNKTIAKIKQEVGSQAFEAQYQQNPLSIDNGFVKKSWLNYYAKLPPELIFFISVDCAIEVKETSDYSAISVISFDKQNNLHYLVDVIRGKLNYPDLKDVLHKIIAKYNPKAVLIEDKATGSALLREMKAKYNNIIAIIPKGDKISRFANCMIAVESGRFLLPKNAIWLEDFELELLTFPYSKNDDQVDTISQYFGWISNSQAFAPKVRFL